MESQPDPSDPIVIGIYGLPSTGKTCILKELKGKLERFIIHEGNEMIDKVCPGGLPVFQLLEESVRMKHRALAIRRIQQMSKIKGAPALVAGHYSTWSEKLSKPQPIWTEDDQAVYTHIIYIDTPAEMIEQHCSNDKDKKQLELSTEEINDWKKFEKDQLRLVCEENNILYFELPTRLRSTELLVKFIRDFETQTEDKSTAKAKRHLEEIMKKNPKSIDKVLLLNCDKTIAPQDSGLHLAGHSSSIGDQTTLGRIFASKLGFSYSAFRQAMLLCEQWFDAEKYEKICEATARNIQLYPEIDGFLRQALAEKHISVVLITCGYRRLWEHVMKRNNLSTKIEVIGGGRLDDGYVVTPKTKGKLVAALQEKYGAYVCAFGESLLDSQMLLKADQAIVVAGSESTRKQQMEWELIGLLDSQENLLDNREFFPRQVILSEDGTSLLSGQRIPIISLQDPNVVKCLLSQCIPVYHATRRNASKLLATPTRDETVRGPQLHDAHKAIGRYLALEYISNIIGVEEYPVPHVLGHQVGGHRLMMEHFTLIVPVMRAGEPLALGIYETFPRAKFLHATKPEDITGQDLQSIRTILLVDSVINSGDTISRFLHQIRRLDKTVTIVVVAGIIHRPTIAASEFANDMRRIGCMNFVALRLSNNNQYKCRGFWNFWDTGNRLFGRG